jgi:putative Mn2+ efflux pump MntP
VAWKLIALIVPLGLDTFAVSAALAMAGLPAQRRLRVSLLMSAFEAGMPLIGLALGAPLGHALGDAADDVAIGVLVAFGLHTLLGDDDSEAERLGLAGRLRGWGAVALGVSVSLDELAIGFALGLVRAPIVLVIVLIAVQAFVLAQLGLRLGSRLGVRLRERAETLAGAALLVLGGVLLAERLW